MKSDDIKWTFVAHWNFGRTGIFIYKHIYKGHELRMEKSSGDHKKTKPLYYIYDEKGQGNDLNVYIRKIDKRAKDESGRHKTKPDGYATHPLKGSRPSGKGN